MLSSLWCVYTQSSVSVVKSLLCIVQMLTPSPPCADVSIATVLVPRTPPTSSARTVAHTCLPCQMWSPSLPSKWPSAPSAVHTYPWGQPCVSCARDLCCTPHPSLSYRHRHIWTWMLVIVCEGTHHMCEGSVLHPSPITCVRALCCTPHPSHV